MGLHRFHSRLALYVLGTVAANQSSAQTVSPVTVTPPTLRPDQINNGFSVNIPEAGRLTPPAGSESLSVTLGAVSLDGGFPEVAGEVQPLVSVLRGHNVSLAQIYDVASKIEAAHARAGYVLARVTVPPQELRDGSALRIVVVDGTIGEIDASGVPARVRDLVASRVAPLRGRPHLRLRDIEAPLLLASSVPGLTLRSTLARGSEPGTTRLILDGTHQRISGGFGGDNQLAASLGTWSVNAQIALNAPFGGGEQLYGFISSGYDLSRTFASDVRARVIGGGLVVPFGDGRFSLNPEATFSRTQPSPALGAPPSLGDLRRFTLRANYIAERTRRMTTSVSGTIEQIEESNKIPLFGFTISRDRYLAARLGVTLERSVSDGSSYGVLAQISQGLGDLGAISLADTLASGVPFSRQGAANSFAKISGQFRGAAPLGPALNVNVVVKAQTSFGTPLFRAEQFALEGSDGASAFLGGVTAVDEGAVARAELRGRFVSGKGQSALEGVPYLFAAAGAGSISRPTVLEPSSLKVASFGVGLHASLPQWHVYFDVEYAHGVSDLAAVRTTDRGNVSISFRF